MIIIELFVKGQLLVQQVPKTNVFRSIKTAETINKRTWKVYFKFNSALSKLSRAGPTWYSFPFPSFLKCDKIVCTLRRKWLVFLCMTLNCISERKLSISNGYEFLRRFFFFWSSFFLLFVLAIWASRTIGLATTSLKQSDRKINQTLPSDWRLWDRLPESKL